MRLILSDIENISLKCEDDTLIIRDNGKRCHCVGCFGCWIKTPGECILRDGYEHLGTQFSNCTELVIISKCTYGSVSPFIKNILDRALSYVQPSFQMIKGEMHHKRRYDNTFKVIAYFYGDAISNKEKETARKLIKANSINYHAEVGKIVFLKNANELVGEL